MTRRVIHVEGSEQVVRADQLIFLVPGQIGKVEESEIVVLEYKTERLGVFRSRILDLRRRGLTKRIRGAGARSSRHGGRQKLAGSSDEHHVKACNRNLVARL